MKAWPQEAFCRGRLRVAVSFIKGVTVRLNLPQLARFSKKASKYWNDGIFLSIRVSSHWLTIFTQSCEISILIRTVSRRDSPVISNARRCCLKFPITASKASGVSCFILGKFVIACQWFMQICRGQSNFSFSEARAFA